MDTTEGGNASGSGAEAERRQVTVVYVDLIGSSRLAEMLDPEDLSELIVLYRRAATAAIEAHGGFVAHYLGDGVLAYWGYPKAREQDPGRAVAAGLAVVAAIADLNPTLSIADVQLSIRIGIDSGIVVVGQLGRPNAASAADIIGEAPNTAAHVQQLAGANTVLITETVRRLVEWQFHLADFGTHQLKSLRAPVRIYRVVGKRPDSQRARPVRSDRIYDREVELSMLDRCWRDAMAGRGQIIFITGEPGIGKTTLVDHFRRTVIASGGRCLFTNCFPEGVHTPLLAIRDLLRQALESAPLDDMATLRERVDAIVSRDRLDPNSANQFLLPLLDPSASQMTLAGYGGSERTRRAFAFVADCLRTIAGRSSFSIVVEDVHWADSSSLELLDLLMAQVAGTRLCLVLTWRSGFETTWIDRADVTRISVMRLKDETVEALVAGMADENVVEPATRHTIATRAEGNPLFAEELVLLARQPRMEGRSADVLTLPSSLNDSLFARLDDLGEFKPIAQVAAAIGREFDERVLASVLDVPCATLAPKLETLVATGVVVDLGPGLQASHAFKHALMRDAAYNSMLKARRRTIHARVAQVLTNEFSQIAEAHPELVAQHYEEADLLGEAVTWWIRAGEQAGRQSTTADAVRLLERALALVPRSQAHSARRAEVLNLLGVQYIAAHGYASALVEQAFGEAAEILEKYHVPAQLFTALWGLHVHAMVRSDIPRAVQIGTRMLELAEAEGDPQKILQVHRLQGLARLLMGAHSQAAQHYGQVLRQYDPVVHRSHRFRYGGEPAALALAQLAWSQWVCGRIALSDRHALEATAHARKTGHAHSVVYVIAVNALRLLTARRFSDSAEAAAEAHYLAEKNSFPYWIAWCDIILAALERPADPDRGRTLLAAAIQRYEQTGARQLIPYAHALEAECCLDLYLPTEAKLVLDAALRLVEETGVRLYQAELLRLRACTAYRLGENGNALLAASLKLARSQVARSFELRSLVTGLEEAIADETLKTARNSLTRLLLEMTNEPETIDMSAARRLL